MARGGMFDTESRDFTEVAGQGGTGSTPTGAVTAQTTKGGLFDDGSGTNVEAASTAAGSASDARTYARDAQGWAVGENETALNGWSNTNNAMYYADLAADWRDMAQTAAAAAQVSANDAAASATSAAGSASAATTEANRAQAAADSADSDAAAAATSASEAASSATSAASSATNAANSASAAATDASQAAASASAAASSASDAAASATTAAGSATNAANSATAAAQSATDSAQSATDAANSATSAANSATSADSERALARLWAIGTIAQEPEGSAKYWAEQAAADAGSITNTTVIAGDGINVSHDGSHNYTVSVDTDTIIDSDYFNTNAGSSLFATTVGHPTLQLRNADSGVLSNMFLIQQYGVTISPGGNTQLQFGVDTDVIADTEWVKDYVTTHGGEANLTAGFGLTEDGTTLSVDTDVIADTDWVRNQGVHTSKFFKLDTSNGTPASATAEGAVAIGISAMAGGQNSLAIGDIANTPDINSVAIGKNAGATGEGSVALGSGAETAENEGVAIGLDVLSSGLRGVAMGSNSDARGQESLAVGQRADADSDFTVALGKDTRATGLQAVAIGDGTVSSGIEAIAIGSVKGVNDRTTASGDNSLAVGSGAEASGQDSIAIGEDAEATDTDAIAIGDGTNAHHYRSIALGNGATTDTDNQMVIDAIQRIKTPDFHHDTLTQFITVNSDGTWGLADGTDGSQEIAGYGINITTSGNNQTISVDTEVIADTEWVKAHITDVSRYVDIQSTLGAADATAGDAIAIGPLAEATGGNSIAIGHHTGATANDSIHIGSQNADGGGVDPQADRGIAIGRGALVAGNSSDSIALGSDATVASGHPGHFAISPNITTVEVQSTSYNDTETTGSLARGQWVLERTLETIAISEDQTDTIQVSLNNSITEIDHFIVHANFGINAIVGNTGSLELNVDTDYIATRQWVLEQGGGGGSSTWENGRDSDVLTEITRVVVDQDTGFEVVMDGTGVARIQRYTAPTNFALQLGNGQANRSWFNTDTTNTATVGASHGSLTNIDSATVNNSNAGVTIDNGSNQVTHPVSATAGSYTLRVNATGANSDNSETNQTASASHSWTVYRDYFIATNVADTDVGPGTSGRHQSNLGNTSFNAVGNCFISVPAGVSFTLSDAFGNIPLTDSSSVTISLNGVDHTYDQYYLGHYVNNTINVNV